LKPFATSLLLSRRLLKGRAALLRPYSAVVTGKKQVAPSDRTSGSHFSGLAAPPLRNNQPRSDVGTNYFCEKPLTLPENSTIGPNVAIGDNSVIKKASIQNCVIWKNEEVHSSQISGQVIAKC